MNDQTTPLSLENPLGKRLLAWAKERFPLANGILCIVLYITAALVGRHLENSGPVSISFVDIVGALLCWSFFLVLRVFDEHKDYELDVKNHPQRVLQSGLITLGHLKVVGVVAILLQFAWSVYLDKGLGSVTTAWLIMFGWACLMGKEFFCGEWLEKRLVLYAFSHMLIMPLIMWWLVQMGQPSANVVALIITLGALFFVSGFAFEITRKTRGPDEERETVDSYSKIFGAKGSALVVLILILTMVVLQYYVVTQISSSTFWVGAVFLLAGLLISLVSLSKFLKQPSLVGRERNEKAVAMTMLFGYGVVIAEVISENGVILTLF
ncbi:prenyltransferase [Gammaproteobacteria bacterium 42_54_T18]|nr:prenyltransferase [Gammaproteobacteria bacterium 42_54_T18]